MFCIYDNNILEWNEETNILKKENQFFNWGEGCLLILQNLLSHNIQLNSNLVGASYSLNAEGLNNLLKELTCVQCRGLLLEWLRTIDNQRLQLRSS